MIRRLEYLSYLVSNRLVLDTVFGELMGGAAELLMHSELFAD
jgi:hypothetical protein